MFNLILLILCGFALYYSFRGAPYLPTSNQAIELMVKEAGEPKPGMKVADIGSGTGKIIIAFAKTGFEAHGFEINPVLVWITNRKIRRLGLEKTCFVHLNDFWHVDFSPFSVVTLFGIRLIMPRLEKKLQTELKPGSQVFSHIFEFPTWKLSKKSAQPSVFTYTKD